MAETSVTIALRLAQEMAATKQPNTGKLQAGSPVNAAEAASLWFNNQDVDWLDLTVDANWAHSKDGLVSVTAIGCSVAAISWMCSAGVALADIKARVNANPYVHLAECYIDLGSDAWGDFQAAVRNLPDGVQNNDPFNAFGVQWPQVLSLAQRIYDLVTGEIARGAPEATIVQEIQNLISPPGTGPDA